jgi:hypothetical protein
MLRVQNDNGFLVAYEVLSDSTVGFGLAFFRTGISLTLLRNAVFMTDMAKCVSYL